jgi:phosphoglycolate phosphatase
MHAQNDILAADLLNGATIAFDLDGTLVDTAPDLVASLNIILAEEGLPPLPFDDVRKMVGRGAKALLERGFAAAGAPLDADQAPALVERFIALYLGRIAHESAPFPGVVEALVALRAAGAKLAVCTNKLTHLSVALLDALDLTQYFDAVVGADSAPAAKPDPRHVLATIAAVGGDPARAVMVGDSINDALAAKAANVPTLLVTFGYTEAPVETLGGDLLIDAFSDVPSACITLLTSCEGALPLPGRRVKPAPSRDLETPPLAWPAGAFCVRPDGAEVSSTSELAGGFRPLRSLKARAIRPPLATTFIHRTRVGDA